MKKRVVTKVGDVFSIKVSNKKQKYFQLIAFDLTQLNSDVIRAFEGEHPVDTSPELSKLVTSRVQFYAHCVTSWGVKLGYWAKVGNCKDVGDIGQILFRKTPDYVTRPGADPIAVSSRWYVWRINDPEFTYVGKLIGNNRESEIGVVFDPASIVHRVKTGKYKWFYPDFE